MDVQSELLPTGELFAALHAEKIRFIIVGGAAASLHGVPLATVDVDIWVDLPTRQYVRILAVAKRLGAEILSGNVIGLRGDQRVDFLYRIDGLAPFGTEYKRAAKMMWAGQPVRVLPLERAIRSKEISNRPKDLVHVHVMREYMACSRIARQRRPRKG